MGEHKDPYHPVFIKSVDIHTLSFMNYLSMLSFMIHSQPPPGEVNGVERWLLKSEELMRKSLASITGEAFKVRQGKAGISMRSCVYVFARSLGICSLWHRWVV